MINIKKGTAYTLSQSDFTGSAKDSEGVLEGMLIRKEDGGDIVKGGAAASATPGDAVNAARYGFALHNQSRGDVISSGKVGAIGLDGNSVIETDQFEGVIGDYQIGESVIPSATGTGKVRPSVTNGKALGIVEGNRSLRGTVLLGIKLAA